MAQIARLEVILSQVGDEVATASAKHRPMNSHHEAYAVILEELDEYWAEVSKGGSASGQRDLSTLRLELIHTAAMCVRALYDLC